MLNELASEGNSDEKYSVRVGMPAPDFTLKTEKGDDWQLSKQRGKVVALLFYPKNETIVCTRQLCSVRDNWAEYLETNVVIVGVSPGTPEEHLSFSERHDLPLPILADSGRKVTGLYGSRYLTSLFRAVVIIDAKGIVRTREVMFRAFRPTDEKMLASIRAAKSDMIYQNFIHSH